MLSAGQQVTGQRADGLACQKKAPLRTSSAPQTRQRGAAGASDAGDATIAVLPGVMTMTA